MAGRGQPFPPAGEVPPHTPFRYRRLPPGRTLSECLFFFGIYSFHSGGIRKTIVFQFLEAETPSLFLLRFRSPLSCPSDPPQLKMPKDLRPKPIIDGDCCGCPWCLHVSVCAGHFQAGGVRIDEKNAGFLVGFFFFFLTHCSQVPYVCSRMLWVTPSCCVRPYYREYT